MSWLWLRESLFSVPAAAIAEASKPCVIAVAAVSGGGKTSAANALRERLTDAVALYFDDYDFEGPDGFSE
ncbi:hypothetical protein [Paenibacillus sp. DMB5]|uniref:hypothetical protein n=1 Tax=Paenibacillus sp. DMB5 TaxID=1780103 RepID=UPI00076DE30A|nr:hypothetical protein [Paenibacillus sp. DMB5]KUP23630.1 hypothetical protein AWJ19_09180 [Paenibacillus sp. DMB5]